MLITLFKHVPNVCFYDKFCGAEALLRSLLAQVPSLQLAVRMCGGIIDGCFDFSPGTLAKRDSGRAEWWRGFTAGYPSSQPPCEAESSHVEGERAYRSGSA